MTLRQLVAMWRGKDRQLWWHTAASNATAANCQRDRKTKPFNTTQFHPYFARTAAARGMPLTKGTMSTFAAMFVSEEKRATADQRAAEKLALANQLKAKMRLRLRRAA